MKTIYRIKETLRSSLGLSAVLTPLLLGGVGVGFTSCEDFFEQESDHVMFADYSHLNNASDTIYSLTGIMKKMQALADRTILLGEVRSDLVTTTLAASPDLKALSTFDIDSLNKYNQPRDYYAVINNCNYYLSMVDSAAKNSRDELLFAREIAAVKCYRAWTYLQLAINYGEVIYYDTPVLTKEEAERLEQTPKLDITAVCDKLVNDLLPVVNDAYLSTLVSNSLYDGMPKLGGVGLPAKVDSRFFYFPPQILLGEIYLWANQPKKAAEWYYKYISQRNGNNSTYSTGWNRVAWTNSSWTNTNFSNLWSDYTGETFSSECELITMIPGDSVPYQGNYLELRSLFNSIDLNDSYGSNDYREVSLTPSVGLTELSAAQRYSYVNSESGDTIYAPEEMSGNSLKRGDLRLFSVMGGENTFYVYTSNERVQAQIIFKHMTRNAHIWRRQMVWLHMAEALNEAGYPHFAYQILAKGISNDVIENDIIPHYTADSTYLRTYSFPTTRYGVYNPTKTGGRQNMMGIHSRGSGWAFMNKYYEMPEDTTITDSLARIADAQEKVREMIIDEGALEFAFEGLRYYDLVRIARNAHNPALLADRIYNRRGKDNTAAVKSEIKVDLTNDRNWYLHWGGKIGIVPTQKSEDTISDESDL